MPATTNNGQSFSKRKKEEKKILTSRQGERRALEGFSDVKTHVC
jgi:hypothetical protein